MAQKRIPPPNLYDPPEEKADWTEWWTLINQDGNTSSTELRSILKVPGSADACIDSEEFDYAEVEGSNIADRAEDYSDPYEAAVEATFFELSDRLFSCGASFYPFNITSERIEIRANTIDSVYVFLLLLSKYGKDAGPNRNEGAKLFEDVCAHSLMSFLGDKENYADAQVLGFPRRVSCKNFPSALDKLCEQLGEGEGNKKRPTSKNQKDAKLDVVGWKSFRDKKKAK